MTYELTHPNNHPLAYPHLTKYERGVIHVVTTKSAIIKRGDHVIDKYCYGINAEVMEVIETRPARGDHKVEAIYQRIAI